MAVELSNFDAAKYFTDPKGQAELLTDAFDTGDATYIKNALNTVARARYDAGRAGYGDQASATLPRLKRGRQSNIGHAVEINRCSGLSHFDQSRRKCYSIDQLTPPSAGW
jgi:hypothetical protein